MNSTIHPQALFYIFQAPNMIVLEWFDRMLDARKADLSRASQSFVAHGFRSKWQCLNDPSNQLSFAHAQLAAKVEDGL